MNDLEKLFHENNERLIHKWAHYFEVYHRHFERFRNKEVTIVEIGVSHGGSLRMWRDYFGIGASIYGIDVNPACKKFEEDQVSVFIGSQADRNFLRDLKNKIPPIDILIDDGGHTMMQQIVSFEELFDHIKPDGVYLCEDIHSSYWIEFGGGHKRKTSFIEYSKNFIDYINAFHSKQSSLKVNDFTRSVHSLHYYDSILVIEKRKIEPPYHLKTGKMDADVYYPPYKVNPIKYKLLYSLNVVLRWLGMRGYKWR